MPQLEDITEIASQLCRDFVRKVGRRGQRTFVVTNFKYPDGDFVNIYLERRGDGLCISDLGNTTFRFKISGVEMTESRANWVNAICKIHDVEYQDTVFNKRIQEDTLGTDFLKFCEAISKISTLEYDAEARQRSYLPIQLESLVSSRIEPVRPAYRNWTDSRFDFKNSYPVDYHFDETAGTKNVFHVASREKSTLVSAVSGFLKMNGIYPPTMAIVATDLNLGTHHLDRLQRAATEIRFGVSGNEDSIVDFVLGEVNPTRLAVRL